MEKKEKKITFSKIALPKKPNIVLLDCSKDALKWLMNKDATPLRARCCKP